jgi:O-acetyl-ADP-ribose deacetylase (regulator of RNase III)
MPYTEVVGNLFNSNAQTIVNTVNCVGVMGKGVALEFRLRFPEMFEAYRKVCEEGTLRPGQILPYRKGQPWVLNLAVKDDWKQPSRLEWVEACLERFAANYQALGITSVAFPWIGAMNGGLPWDKVHALMRSYLRPLDDIDIEVFEFDPNSPDPLFLRLRQTVRLNEAAVFARQVGITKRAAALVYQAIRETEVPSMLRLCEFPGLGKKTIERLYAHFRTSGEVAPTQSQLPLFDGQ